MPNDWINEKVSIFIKVNTYHASLLAGPHLAGQCSYKPEMTKWLIQTHLWLHGNLIHMYVHD